VWASRLLSQRQFSASDNAAPRSEMQLLQAHLMAGNAPGVCHQSSADSLAPESREGLQMADRAPMRDDLPAAGAEGAGVEASLAGDHDGGHHAVSGLDGVVAGG
jgi:hypothetical protein